jgi:hypothetical protein
MELTTHGILIEQEQQALVGRAKCGKEAGNRFDELDVK